jgi:vacuolar-type H+-ATPase subunit E/Vma4
MSPKQNGIDALRKAIIAEATEEAARIQADAQREADRIKAQAQAQVDAKRESILRRAHENAKALRDHAAAEAQLEAQKLRLTRREQMLERAFDTARRQLGFIIQRPEYAQIARSLVREAAERLGAEEVVVRADAETQKALGAETLADLSRELGAGLQFGETLAQATGIVAETPDGHRSYDNTFETRLARMHDILRTPVYYILMGKTP